LLVLSFFEPSRSHTDLFVHDLAFGVAPNTARKSYREVTPFLARRRPHSDLLPLFFKIFKLLSPESTSDQRELDWKHFTKALNVFLSNVTSLEHGSPKAQTSFLMSSSSHLIFDVRRLEMMSPVFFPK
jgi:hypothetical protein